MTTSRSYGIPPKYKEGGVQFRAVHVRDITERKQAEEALKASEEKYRNIIETIADGYYEVDLAGNLTFFNEELAKVYGYPKEGLRGMNNRVYTDAENAKKMYQAFNRVFRTGEPDKGLRFEIITSEKTRKNMESSITLIRDASGNPVGFRGIARDISDLIQAQRELKESEERYRTIIETIEDGYYEVDLTGNLTFFNDAMARINGYPREEMMGMHARDYTDAENVELLNRKFIQVYRTRTPSKGISYEVITKNGERKNVETSVSLIRDPSGKPIGFRGIAREITDVIQTQRALKESEERYRTIIETIEDGYYEVNLTGNLTYFNDTMVRIHEYPRAELLGMNNRQYTDAENAKILFKVFNQVYRTGEPSKGTHYEIITKNGGRKNLESSVSLIRDAIGNPIGFRGIVRDVTELRQAQNALKTSEERFRISAQSSNDFIYEWDLESGQVDWFGKAVERLGDLLGEIPDTNVAFVNKIYPEDLERTTEAVRRHLKQGGPHLEEYRLVGKDGNIIHVKSAGMCLRNEAGRGYKWIGALSDITERKRAEEELKESLDKLHKAVGGIIQAMALTVGSRDPYTAGHQQRVSNLARAIAQEMGLSKDQVEAIRMAGVVHDLGKISVPAEILSKPTKLSDLEFSLIKGHSQTSYEILKDIEFPWPIADIALQHHERMNGSGYPSGLKGEEILIEAQVLMVADVVEAIASHRPYRPALGIEVALDEISKHKGKLYTPAAVDACLRLFREKGFKFLKIKSVDGRISPISQ
jgi:PAS domain S-box-containing protein/putative nucleotidyltransferase with HDIG domain